MNKVVDIESARRARQAKKDQVIGEELIGRIQEQIYAGDLANLESLLDMAFLLASSTDPGLQSLRKPLRKPLKKRHRVHVRQVVFALIKHFGLKDTARILARADSILVLAKETLADATGTT